MHHLTIKAKKDVKERLGKSLLRLLREVRLLIADNSMQLSIVDIEPADIVGELMSFDGVDADVDLWVSLQITVPPNLFQGVVTDLEGILVEGVDDAIDWFGHALEELIEVTQDLNLLTVGYNVTWNPGGGAILK